MEDKKIAMGIVEKIERLVNPAPTHQIVDVDEYYKLIKSAGFRMISDKDGKTTWMSPGDRFTLVVVEKK